VDGVLVESKKYEVIGNLLYRLVYKMERGCQVPLCAVPSGTYTWRDVSGWGPKPLTWRKRIMYEYHNGKLAAHPGRHRTTQMIQRDWHWKNMHLDIREHVGSCEFCRGEHGPNAKCSLTRSTLYTCPFRVLVFDTVTVDMKSKHGEHKYIFTCVCAFSRWAWLIPLEEKDADSVARALMKIFLGIGTFPTVLRSDNAKEFIGEVVGHLNHDLDVNHVTGSPYHPQSQGHVERMHRTMKEIVAALLHVTPRSDWVEALPYAEFALRTVPMACLGGMCPYEVVTGLKPRLPRALVAEVAGEEVSVTKYVEALKGHLTRIHSEIIELKKSDIEKQNDSAKGRISQELYLGDHVLVRMGKSQAVEMTPDGVPRNGIPAKFQRKVYDGVFRISKKISAMSFYVERCSDTLKPIKFLQPVNADRLTKIVLSDLGLDDVENVPKHYLELFEDNRWTRYALAGYGVDGHVRLEPKKGLSRWRDLSGLRYRWVERPDGDPVQAAVERRAETEESRQSHSRWRRRETDFEKESDESMI